MSPFGELDAKAGPAPWSIGDASDTPANQAVARHDFVAFLDRRHQFLLGTTSPALPQDPPPALENSHLPGTRRIFRGS